jgi:hypothetical protein
MPVASPTEIKVADEVWIATALLHREHLERRDFAVDEIVDRAKREGLSKPVRKSVYVHVIQHCVANRAPNSGRYRMLMETAPGRRRLFRPGDSYDRAREGSKIVPERDEVPSQYARLLDWYRTWSQDNVEDRIKNDPLLALRGSGKKLWADEHADEYVRRLREGWE